MTAPAGFVMVPAWLLAAQPSGNAVLIYTTLARYGTFNTYAGTYDECRPALATIAADSGLSESSVKRAISELLELGAVTRRLRFAEDGRTPLPTAYTVHVGALVKPTGSTDGPRGGSAREPGVGPPVSRDQEPHTKNQNTQSPVLALVGEPARNVGGSVSARASASGRATRIPEDFSVAQDMRDWFARECPDVDGRAETRKFVDYWRAASGQRARKCDWPATWRNWMRKAQEDATRAQRPARTYVTDRDARVSGLFGMDPTAMGANGAQFAPLTPDELAELYPHAAAADTERRAIGGGQ